MDFRARALKTKKDVMWKFGLHKNKITQSWIYKKIHGPISGVILGFAFFLAFLASISLFSPWTTPGNMLAVLRAMIDVAGVLLGLSGIMFANAILAVTQQVWVGRDTLATRLPGVSFDTLQKYRRSLVNSMLLVFLFLIGSIASSLGFMTRLPEQTGVPLDTISFVWAPILLLLLGTATMAAAMREAPP